MTAAKLRIGHKPLSIREARKLSQETMADLLGISSSSYARIESNETMVTLDRINTFADALGVQAHELFPETVAMTNHSHNSGQGGAMNMGTQYFYVGDSVVKEALSQENIQLKQEVESLKEKLNILLEKLG